MRSARTEPGRQLEKLFRVETAGGLTDGRLLEQFVAGDDEAAEVAFEAIVGARADGPANLLDDAWRCSRGGGYLPGHVPGPGPKGAGDR